MVVRVIVRLSVIVRMLRPGCDGRLARTSDLRQIASAFGCTIHLAEGHADFRRQAGAIVKLGRKDGRLAAAPPELAANGPPRCGHGVLAPRALRTLH